MSSDRKTTNNAPKSVATQQSKKASVNVSRTTSRILRSSSKSTSKSPSSKTMKKRKLSLKSSPHKKQKQNEETTIFADETHSTNVKFFCMFLTISKELVIDLTMSQEPISDLTFLELNSKQWNLPEWVTGNQIFGFNQNEIDRATKQALSERTATLRSKKAW